MKGPQLVLTLALVEPDSIPRTVYPKFCQSFLADLNRLSGALEQLCFSHDQSRSQHAYSPLRGDYASISLQMPEDIYNDIVTQIYGGRWLHL